MRANEFIIEGFDKPYPIKWEKGDFADYDALATLPDGKPLHIMFNNEGDGEFFVEFYRNNSQEVTGEGDAQRVFSTVLNAIQTFIKMEHPWRLMFSASKAVEPGQNSESRAKLYDRLVQRYANAWGYDMYHEDHGDQVTYELTQLKQNVKEDSTNKQTTLDDLYQGEYPDEDELIWNFVSNQDFDVPFTVKTLNANTLKYMLLDTYGVDELKDLFKKMQPDQRATIEYYKNDTNLSQHIIVVNKNIIIDGNHRALAAALRGVSINCIDLSELDNVEVDEDISRRGFLGGLAGAALGATGAQAKMHPNATPALKAKPVANNPKVELLLKWAKQFIKDPAELAAFMAQCAHESDNFVTMNEYGTPERFAKKYDIQYNPKKAKELGNDKPGDGIKYHGRGYIQLTGKYNYEEAGKWISKFLDHPVDFVSNPNMVATPTAAALSSIWYWLTFVRPRTKNFSNTKQVTQKINTGLKGQANREQKAKDWQTALHVKPIKPGQGIKVASK